MRKLHLTLIGLLLLSLTAWAQDDTVSNDLEDEAIYEDSAELSNEFVDTDTAVVDSLFAAQFPPDSLPQTEEYRSADRPVDEFDRAKWSEIIGDANYDEKVVKPKAPAFNLPKMPWLAPVLKFGAYAVLFAALIAIIVYIIRNTTFQPKIEKKSAVPDINGPVDNIEELDLDALMKEAMASRNWRNAVRVHFLMLLKHLHAGGMIEWKKDKTNRDYLSELFNRQFHFDEVRKLTNAYELVWYGDRNVNDTTYELLSKDFEMVRSQVKIPEKQ